MFQDVLELGNLNAERDWGFAGDYVRAMWQMLQQEQPDDYVIATGEKHTVREFTTLAFAHVDIHIQWVGEGLNEVGVDSSTGIVRVRVEPRYFRPAEVDLLVGDSSKARAQFNWEPSCSFQQLVQMMMDADLQSVSSER
ncbi:GDPmannose 4,6-dehydratase [Paragonimus westermani]|uniref:GDP-mannose 4,6-dehydratase n=1 Tax=Paragonimus westermani TaxID=34504 RepID=A0A5J4NJV4_9TREM|nr:GDPmannose 4,6-dehydratase [Paragonimus westermani]